MVDLKPLDEQVVVITGATSGIGLATARTAAERGARLVLAARSEDALAELADEITASGGDAVYVVADVRDRADVSTVAAVAEDTYGGFDTWVNNASAFVYGELREVPIEDMRELFETNVWGTLYGSLEAADHLEDRGGAIINVGSLVSDRAMVLQGSYSASKHAVKAFTDALRMELQRAGAPVSVTLVKPSAIDTPYPEHAKNHMDDPAELPPPLYAPETVARTILHAAEHSTRDAYVGGVGKFLATLGRVAPGLTDTIMERVFYRLMRRGDEHGQSPEGILDAPTEEVDADDERLRARGEYEGHVSETSLYTRLARRGRGKLVGAVLVGLAVLWYARRSDDRDRAETSEAVRSRGSGTVLVREDAAAGE